MGKEVHELMACECFYLDTNLEFAREDAIWIDKCLILVVEKGIAEILVGDNEYAVDSHCVLFLHPDISWRIKQASDDFSVALIGFPHSMLNEGLQRIEPGFLLFLYTRVVWRLSSYDYELVEHFKGLFRFAVSRYGLGYSRELVITLVTGVLYGAYEISGYRGQQETLFSDSSRSRELFMNFMMLLHAHFTRQHDVQFYAGELCISAKYLTQITKRMIGRTPKQIIDDRLIHEATKLLGQNNSSIQDISVKLGFPDQSYFGRFFKRLKQISPQQYRIRPNR